MAVYSWGRGDYGQLGLGDKTDRHVPVAIEALQEHRIVQISCGTDHTAALTDVGEVYTWGGDGDGQLGHDGNNSEVTPRLVVELSGKNVSQVACSRDHTAAVTASSDLYTWGWGGGGKLGHGTTTDLAIPSLVQAFQRLQVRQVACGSRHMVALLESTDVYAWGDNDDGVTGLGKTKGHQCMPCPLKELRGKDIVQISACGYHTAALSEFGEVFTFGKGEDGRLGHNSERNESVARFVAALAGKHVKQVDCGGLHTAALTETGEVYTWGWGSCGQLGHGNEENKTVPTRIEMLAGNPMVAIACGWGHTVAITNTGKMYTWGKGENGRLGHNRTMELTLPKLVEALGDKRVISVASYDDHTLALVQSVTALPSAQQTMTCTMDTREMIYNDKISEAVFVSPLLNAAWAGHVEAVKNALQAGQNVEARDTAREDETPLIWAAIRGHVEIIQILLDGNALIDAQTKFGSTALKRAAGYDRLEVVRVLLDRGADVALPDQDGFTALHDAASRGHTKVVELLLEWKASADAKTNRGYLPLDRAARRGHLETVQILLNRGASVDPVNSDGYSPLMLASKAGQVQVVQLLLERGADLSRGFYTGWRRWTPRKLARYHGRLDVVTAIKKFQASQSSTSKSLFGGSWINPWSSSSGHTRATRNSSLSSSEKQTGENNENTKAPQIINSLPSDNQVNHEASTSTDDPFSSMATTLAELRELCTAMDETSEICEHVRLRLEKTCHALQSVVAAQDDAVVGKFEQIVGDFQAFVAQHTENKSAVERLVSTRTIVGLLREFHRRIDDLNAEISPDRSTSPASTWQQQWEADALTVERSLIKDMEANAGRIKCELGNDPADQKDALTLLMYEIQQHKDKYSAEMQEQLTRLQDTVIRISVVSVDKVPSWFIPRHEVQMQEQIARGAFGRVHRGTWLKARVIVKCVTVKSSEEMDTFMKEVKLWRKARHANIVNFFGACHKGEECFFVCEEANKGSLVDFLYEERKSGRCSVWRKLHQAALGLYFLHKEHIVHGDLKGNNILIGEGEKALITDFGLSSLAEEATPAVGSVGALRWKAPECIRKGDDRSAPTFESDVYSFGMCVVEAVTGQVPWGSLPDVSIRWHLLRKKEPLKRPKALENDEHWALVEAMCALEPSERMKLEDVIDRLEAFAEQEKLEQREQHRS